MPTTRRFIAIQAMMLEPHARSYDSGEDGIFPECRSCRFHRPYALRQTCVFRLCPYESKPISTVRPATHWRLAYTKTVRFYQRQRIKREYIAAKAGRSASLSGNAASKAVRRRPKPFAGKKKHVYLVLALVAMLGVLLNAMSSCAPLLEAGMQAFVMGTYPAEEADIKAVERAYRQMEKELQDEMEHYTEWVYVLSDRLHASGRTFQVKWVHLEQPDWEADSRRCGGTSISYRSLLSNFSGQLWGQRFVLPP